MNRLKYTVLQDEDKNIITTCKACKVTGPYPVIEDGRDNGNTAVIIYHCNKCAIEAVKGIGKDFINQASLFGVN